MLIVRIDSIRTPVCRASNTEKREEKMSQGFLEVGLPTLIALVFVNFVWAWVVTATKPPEGTEEERVWNEGDLDRIDLGDAGPEGIRKGISEEIQPKTKVVE